MPCSYSFSDFSFLCFSLFMGNLCPNRHDRLFYFLQPLPDSGENGGTFSQRHAPSAYFCHAHRNAHQFSSGHTAGYCVRGSFVGLSQTVCRTGTVSCGFKQSAEIRFGSASHCVARQQYENHHSCRNFRRRLRRHHESVYRLLRNRSG